MEGIAARAPVSGIWAGIPLGLWAAVVAVVPTNAARLALVVPLAAAVLVSWLILQPNRWLVAFFCAALLLPPLPIPLGDSGVHVAPLAAAVGVLASILWIREWSSWAHPVTGGLLAFLAVLLESLASATLYSGWQIAAASLARVLLFAVGAFIFLYTYAGPATGRWRDRQFVRLLFGLAVAGAVFACADFYYQFPAPAGYGDQFVWLQDSVLRRAQGIFYEASTLGNFCAFFWVMVAVSLLRPKAEAPCSRPWLLLGGLVIGAALILSYSRASVLNVAVAALVLACIRFGRFRRSIVVMLATVGVAVVAVYFVFPSFANTYWDRLVESSSVFTRSPDEILSGRVAHWQVLADFLARQPWHAVLGVGYKTLPYSTFIGETVVADNTYLGLLVETGLVGLTAFLVLNFAILRTGWRALRSPNPETSFLGEWIFCFWCGQMVQMLSGDLITYWRVLPVYFWVLGAAARRTRRDA